MLIPNLKHFFSLLKMKRTDKERAEKLKILNRRLLGAKNAYYSPVSQKLSPQLAESFERFKKTLDRLHPFLTDTVGEQTIDDIRKKLTRKILSSHQLTPEKLSFASIREEIGQDDRTGTIKMEKLFRNRISMLSIHKTKDIQKQFAGLRILNDCMNYDFDAMVKPFKKRKGYKSIKGHIQLQQLEDLYYLQSGWKPDRINFKLLLLLLTIQKRLTKRSHEELIQRWSAIEDYWERVLPSDQLADIIRSIKSNPDYEIRTIRYKESFIVDYLKQTSKRFSIQIRQYRDLLNQKSRDEHISRVFGDSNMEDLIGFSRNDEDVLSKGVLSLTPQIEVLRIVKTFVNRYVETEIQPVLFRFIEAVQFFEEDMKKRVNSAAGTICILPLDIQGFEVMLKDTYSESISAWIKIIQNKEMDDMMRKKATIALKRINSKADAITQKCFDTLGFIARTHKAIEEDLRMKDGKVISNGRYLLQQETPLLRETESVIVLINKFIGLLDEYILDRSKLKSAINEKKQSPR